MAYTALDKKAPIELPMRLQVTGKNLLATNFLWQRSLGCSDYNIQTVKMINERTARSIEDLESADAMLLDV